jgi:hypothetical protein
VSNVFGYVPWGGRRASPAGSGLVLDALNSFQDAIYRLGFLNPAEITSVSWTTEAELFQFADEALKKIAYSSGVFLTVDSSITAVAGTAAYALPATHVFTVAATLMLGGGVLQLLRPTPVRDLWALDANWSTSTGTAARFSLDAGAVGTITLYPNPIAGGTLAQVCQEFPATLTPAASTVALPTPLQDYVSYAMLAGARGKESDAQMTDMAAHYQQRCALYEQVIDHLFGPGQ